MLGFDLFFLLFHFPTWPILLLAINMYELDLDFLRSLPQPDGNGKLHVLGKTGLRVVKLLRGEPHSPLCTIVGDLDWLLVGKGVASGLDLEVERVAVAPGDPVDAGARLLRFCAAGASDAFFPFWLRDLLL